MTFDALIGTPIKPEALIKSVAGKGAASAAETGSEPGTKEGQKGPTFESALRDALTFGKPPKKVPSIGVAPKSELDDTDPPSLSLAELASLFITEVVAHLPIATSKTPETDPSLTAHEFRRARATSENRSEARKNLPVSGRPGVEVASDSDGDIGGDSANDPGGERTGKERLDTPVQRAAQELAEVRKPAPFKGLAAIREQAAPPVESSPAPAFSTPATVSRQPTMLERAPELARGLQAYATRDAVRIERTSRGGRASLHLDLGDGQQVDLRLDVEDGVARVVMSSRTPELQGWLHRSADQLMRALVASGFTLDGVEVDVGSNGDDRGDEGANSRGGRDDLPEEVEAETIWFDALPSKIHIVT